MKYNEATKRGTEMMMKNLKSHLENEEKEGRVAVGIIAVTVEPFGAGTVILTDKNIENALAEMGYIDEGEILTLLQNHGKKIIYLKKCWNKEKTLNLLSFMMVLHMPMGIFI